MNDRLFTPASLFLLTVCSLILISGILTPVRAQIQAPDLICIDNDTLVWTTPANTCGPFRGYIVFGSQNENGPFNPIDTVVNAQQTTYFHEAAGGDLWYYYLTSDHDCPGLTPLTSDTLDNRIPEIGPLLSASVDRNTVILNWSPSPSPETIGYIISRNTSAGTTIIDTVFNQTTYTDIEAAANDKAETYFVTAIDACGNTSLVATPHTTMFLQGGEIDACEQSIAFSWTPYAGWDNGVERYEILVNLNSAGTTFTVDGSTDGATTQYAFNKADQGEIYCFAVRAYEADGTNTAESNIICEVADVIQPIRELIITNTSFNANNDVAVTWRWNANAQLTEATLLRSVDNGSFTPIHNINVSAPLSAENTFTDANVPDGAGALCYRVETVDLCGDGAESNAGCTINLTAVSDGQGANRVNWTPFDFGQSTSLSYELFRVQGGAATSVATLNGNETTFLDQVDLTGGASGTICYYVVATATLTLPGSGQQSVTTRSNTACTEESSKIYIPNAFAPDGVNTEFRAYLQFGDPAEFLLEVYDRWGNKVFAGQSVDQAWDGTKDGQDLPSGVYVYRLFIQQNNGNTIERAGSVALIR